MAGIYSLVSGFQNKKNPNLKSRKTTQTVVEIAENVCQSCSLLWHNKRDKKAFDKTFDSSPPHVLPSFLCPASRIMCALFLPLEDVTLFLMRVVSTFCARIQVLSQMLNVDACYFSSWKCFYKICHTFLGSAERRMRQTGQQKICWYFYGSWCSLQTMANVSWQKKVKVR